MLMTVIKFVCCQYVKCLKKTATTINGKRYMRIGLSCGHIQHPPPSAITVTHTPVHIPHSSSTPAITIQHQVSTTPAPTILPAR